MSVCCSVCVCMCVYIHTYVLPVQVFMSKHLTKKQKEQSWPVWSKSNGLCKG